MSGQMLVARQPKREAAAVIAPTIGLAVVAAGLVAARLVGLDLPLVSSDRAAVVALLVVGLALCGTGPLGRLIEAKAWLSPFFLVGIAVGSLALVAAAVYLLGGAPLGIADDRAALVALAAVVATKLAVGMMARLTRAA